MNELDVLIVGSGITGLALAYYLEKAGYKVLILESNSHIGGVIFSSFTNGFLLEQGPNSSLAKEDLIKLINDLNLADHVVYPKTFAKKRFLAVNNKLLSPAPRNFLQAITSPILSFKGKIRFIAEPLFANKPTEDQDINSFISTHFGEEFAERVVAAMLGGIWAADTKKLSTRSVLPSIWDLASKGSIILNGLKKSLTKKQKKSFPHIVSFKQGMQQLADTLAKQLQPGTIQLNFQVNEINLFQDHVEITASNTESSNHSSPGLLRHSVPRNDDQTRHFRGKFLIITTPAEVTSNLIKKFDPHLASKIQNIPYSPLGILHLAFKKSDIQHPLDGFGFLVPPTLNMALLGAIFNSSLFEHRSPADQHLLTCFVGGATKPDLANVTDENIIKRVIAELAPLIGSTAQPIILKKTYLTQAIPNYPVKHYQLQNQLKDFHANHSNCLITGNWLKGTSVVERIEEAKGIAMELIDRLYNKESVTVYGSPKVNNG